jgi:ribosomal protein RSM22 (predicted rRNA methylase)
MLTASLPPELERALADATRGRGSPRASADLTRRYRDTTQPPGPVARSPDDVGAYAVARLPATYAAIRVALDELRSRLPSFEPASLLDLGAGPGTAAWAADAAWPSLAHVTNVEPEAEMRRLGIEVARSAPSHAVAEADWLARSLPSGIPSARFDLVTLSYVLGEIDECDRPATVERAWDAAAHALVVVEPGTPAGYERMLHARDRLIELGATIGAPCPHDRACPLAGTGDWCHFAVRLARTRAHREAKDAQLGHEDEKFSYVVAARTRAPQAAARILRHPQIRRGHVLLEVCAPDGARAQTVSKREGDRYRRARKVAWGEDLGE